MKDEELYFEIQELFHVLCEQHRIENNLSVLKWKLMNLVNSHSFVQTIHPYIDEKSLAHIDEVNAKEAAARNKLVNIDFQECELDKLLTDIDEITKDDKGIRNDLKTKTKINPELLVKPKDWHLFIKCKVCRQQKPRTKIGCQCGYPFYE